MEIKIPKIKAIKFNKQYLDSGTPIKWRQTDTHGHYLLALVKEYGPNLLQVYNGHIFNTFNVLDVNSGAIEIIPLRGMEDGGKIIVETIVFDIAKIPAGSIFIDADDMSFMINEVDPYYLEIIDHKGKHRDIQAENFFALDDEENDCRIVLPPLFVEEMKQVSQRYKDNV